MRIEIEVYKGQTIEYDDENDKFICDISIEDKNKSTKRMSLKDVRKEIDNFIKTNLEFKPFKALFLSRYGGVDFFVYAIEAIRTDCKFIVNTGGGKSHYDQMDMKLAMQYDADIVNEGKRLKNELDAAKNKYYEGMKELCSKLTPMDLSKYGVVREEEKS